MASLTSRFRSLWVVVAATVLIVGGRLRAEPIPIRELGGKEYSEAVQARDRADRMRAALEKQMAAARRKTKAGSQTGSDRRDAEIDNVIRAYQEIISRYAHTNFAADAALSLMGFYQFLGEFKKAAEAAAHTANEFAGTPLEAKIAFNAGLVHSQALRDPVEALTWFARVPKPDKAPGDPYTEEDKFYYAAQQQMLKCELQLGQGVGARDRADRLKETLPQFAAQIDRDYRSESAAHRGSDVTPDDRGSLLRRFVISAHLIAAILLTLWLLLRSKKKGLAT